MTVSAASLGARARIPGVRVIPGQDLVPSSMAIPDNDTTVWPMPHDPKIDVIEVLRAAFTAIGLEDHEFGISKDGAFTVNSLKNSEGQSIPFIVVTRTGDLEKRYGIGKHFGTFRGGDPLLVDDEQVVPPDGYAQVRGTFSQVSLAVDIFDIDANRADQMYLIVKYILEAALESLNDIGYVHFKRVNGQDGQKIEMNESTPYVIFNRTLSYEAWHPMFVDTIDRAVNLIKQTLLLSRNPQASEPETTVL